MGNRRRLGQKGQASIMIGIMMLTFATFLTFVVNTGSVINAKINLQNAADLAAYAGAATQARLLNEISYLNYEMREAYKMFLFRYYVIGNYAQKQFPQSSGGSKQPHVWSPDITLNPQVIYDVPAVCVIFKSNDNTCQVGELTQINTVAPNPLDQIQSTLSQQLGELELIRQQNCGAMSTFNLTLLALWLYNTDPTLSALNASGTTSNNQQALISVAKTLTQGTLGLIPQEILLDARIQTLATYLNSAPIKGMNMNAVTGLQQGTDPATYERSIQSFLSAYYTLGSHSFDASTISMDELQPAQIFNLQTIKKDFDAYAVDFKLSTNDPSPSATSANCVPVLSPMTVNQLPVGVAKDPTQLTYYAVKLTATANPLMGKIFGPIEMSAYAAARPFGSRIGPSSTALASQFFRQGTGNSQYFPSSSTGFNEKDMANQIPDLVVDSQSGESWDYDSVLGAMFSQISGGSPLNVIDSASVMRGLASARTPTLSEVGQYNIPFDNNGLDPINVIFDSNRIGAFWAPLFDPAQGTSAGIGTLTTLIQGLIAPTPGSSINSGPSPMSNAQFIAGLSSYVNLLQQGQGTISGLTTNPPVTGDGINIVRFIDPVFNPFAGANPTQPLTVPGVSITSPGQLKTSWYATTDNANMSPSAPAGGRVGYSVKFVSFESLRQPLKTDGQTTSSNPLDADPDTFFIKH